MHAGDLRTGDIFVEIAEKDWTYTSPIERKKAKRVAVLALGPECRHDRTRVHFRTSVGTWCMPFVADVTKVGHGTKAEAA